MSEIVKVKVVNACVKADLFESFGNGAASHRKDPVSWCAFLERAKDSKRRSIQIHHSKSVVLCLAKNQSALSEVNVSPSQGQYLAAAHSCEHCNRDDGTHGFSCHLDQVAQLGWLKVTHSSWREFWCAYAGGGIGWNQLPFNCR